MGNSCALIGIDWGSTRVRAHAFDRDGRVVASRQGDRGMASLHEPGAFADALRELLAAGDFDDGQAPILLAGMVGARAGWVEAPYVDMPVDATRLAGKLTPLAFDGRRAAIVPGVCGIDADYSDVMRGEEVQALGLSADTSRAVAPGTHSKWLRLHDGRIEHFATYPTGEMYAVLMQHSLLGRGLPADAWSEESFLRGIAVARTHPDWLHQLFGVRARFVRDLARPEDLPAFLSGMLIGYECVAALAREAAGEITIVGGGDIASTYALALREFQATTTVIAGDAAFCRGLWRIAQSAEFT